MTRDAMVCSPDLDRHVQALRDHDVFDETYVANIGPHCADTIRLYGAEVLPAVAG